MRAAAAAMVFLAAPAIAPAQMLVRDADLPPARAVLVLGWDPIWTVGVGVVLGVDRAAGGHDLGLELILTAPLVLIPTLRDWKVTAGAGLLVPMGEPGGTGLALDLKTGLASSDDAASRNLAWVVELSVAPGYWGPRAGAGLEVGWRGALATYVAHHALVEDTYGDRPGSAVQGPRDGWYPLASSRARVGLVGHVALGDHARVFGAAGFEWTAQAQGVVSSPPAIKVPFHGSLGVDASW